MSTKCKYKLDGLSPWNGNIKIHVKKTQLELNQTEKPWISFYVNTKY